MITTIKHFRKLNENKSEDLCLRIMDFLDKYAPTNPNYDEEYDEDGDRFTGPDPSMFYAACNYIKLNKKIPFYIHSDWFSGSYKPYTSVEGKELHDELKKEIAIYNSEH